MYFVYNISYNITIKENFDRVERKVRQGGKKIMTGWKEK